MKHADAGVDRVGVAARAATLDPLLRVVSWAEKERQGRVGSNGRVLRPCETTSFSRVAKHMKNWTIRRRILASFGILLVSMMGIATWGYTRLARIKEQATYVGSSALPGLYYGAQMAAAFNLDYSLTQELILQEDAARRRRQLDAINANRAVLQDLLAKYEPTAVTAEDRDLVAATRQTVETFRDIQDTILSGQVESKGNPTAAAKLADQLDPVFEKGQTLFQTVVSRRRSVADSETREILAAATNAELGIAVSFASAVLLAFACGYYLLGAITRPLGALSNHLEQSGLQVNTSVTEIAATAKQQQVMATEVASTTLEIGATSKEISATAKELVRTMNDVSAAAEQSAVLAGSGQAGLTQMEQSMRHVMAAAGAVNAKLAVLNEKAGIIGQVVTTITKVADQTNLLSLNAAIEAEKAGEYGRGFAVVATEIRRLADQTAVSTYDIEQMVKDIQAAVSAGVMSMDKFSDEVRRGIQATEQISTQLSQIIQQAQALAPRVESVNEGMQAQTAGAEQIAEALTQLSSAAQHTVESLRQSSVAIEELHKASAGLSTDVSRFRAQVA